MPYIILVYISYSMFLFANDLWPSVYFIFILDYRNVRQKANLSDFFFFIQVQSRS